MDVTPVIDDRMLVNCWYGNDELSKEIKNNEDFVFCDFGINIFCGQWERHQL